MCLIVTIIMLVLSIQNLMQHQWLTGIVQLIIALGFFALLMRNIIAVRNEKKGCSTTSCGMTDYWFSNLFRRKED